MRLLAILALVSCGRASESTAPLVADAVITGGCRWPEISRDAAPPLCNEANGCPRICCTFQIEAEDLGTWVVPRCVDVDSGLRGLCAPMCGERVQLLYRLTVDGPVYLGLR